MSFSESGSMGNSSGSDVTSLSSQLPDTPNSMIASPVDTWDQPNRSLRTPACSRVSCMRTGQLTAWIGKWFFILFNEQYRWNCLRGYQFFTDGPVHSIVQDQMNFKVPVCESRPLTKAESEPRILHGWTYVRIISTNIQLYYESLACNDEHIRTLSIVANNCIVSSM